PTDSTAILEAIYKKYEDSIKSTLHYDKGTITLAGSKAKLKIPSNFKFLDSKQSRFVLEELWGNLPDETVLGTIFPENADPYTTGSYVFVVTYENMGYVKDDDVDDINYDDLLKEMKSDQAESNKRRQEAGIATMNLVGWATKPYYDKANNTLHWAKNLQVEGADENTLNYTVMLLGRHGILTLNAVASINDLKAVQAALPEVLKMPEFETGSTYKDFDPGVDNVAAWTIGGLVAGKVLAKAGFFVLLLKFWKIIALGFVALGGYFAKFFKRKKKDDGKWPEDDYAGTVNAESSSTEPVAEIAEAANDAPAHDARNDVHAIQQDTPLK
ncbi:MAG: DUF2167 domain-containing protein, partial [Flavitalea sp.]